MMDVIQIGSMPVSIQTVSFFLSAGAALAILWLISKFLILDTKEPFEWLFQGFFNSIWIWKFSPVVLDPLLTIKHPFTLLYFSGGTKGIILAIVFFLVYAGWKVYRKTEHLFPFIVLAGLLWMIGSGLFPFFQTLLGSENSGSEIFFLAMIITVVWYILKRNNFLFTVSFYGIAIGFLALLYDYSSFAYFIVGILFAVLYLLSLSNLNNWKANLDEEVLKWRM